ncbi:hypothetical protein KC460_05155 [Candidatus Dependentiae bacterium]|nr:hypothetical protein [Candidatus Dependentiae bacterium]
MIAHNIRIVGHLLYRDLKVLAQNLLSRFIDNIVVILVMTILFGSLLPRMGMNASLIGPMIIGTLIQIGFHKGFTMSLIHLYDLAFNRCIDYYITLPLPKKWVFTRYVISFMIEYSIIAIPLLLFGIILLSPSFTLIKTDIAALIIIYFLSSLFLALLFLYISFAYSLEWVKANIWARRLSWLFLFSSTLFPFKPIAQAFPKLSYLFLISPLTYISEGLRSALIGDNIFIPAWYCIGIVATWNIILMYGLSYAATKKLDLI